MTQVANQFDQRRENWVLRTRSLADQVSQWCQAEGWKVEEEEKTIQEDLLGTYHAPTLRIHVPGGELLLNPIALHVVGGNGRVDLEAFPTLARVKLIGIPDGWRIMTDSNVPIRQPWNQKNFVQLAHDLLS
jgi:hypothetical protein